MPNGRLKLTGRKRRHTSTRLGGPAIWVEQFRSKIFMFSSVSVKLRDPKVRKYITCRTKDLLRQRRPTECRAGSSYILGLNSLKLDTSIKPGKSKNYYL